MTTKKSQILALFGIGIVSAAAGCRWLPLNKPIAGEEGTVKAAIEKRLDYARHNRAWREAKYRASALAMRGGKAKDIAKEFENALLSSPDIKVNVCVSTAISTVNNAAIGDDASAVVNVINALSCEQ